MVAEYCNGCAYLGLLTGGLYCAFCDVTGHSRGCGSGEGCIRRVEGKRRYSPNYFSHTKNPPPQEPPKVKAPRERKSEISDTERKRKLAEKYKALLQGRQKVAITSFRNARGLTNLQLAHMAGVAASTLEKWISEYSVADWEKLTAIGIQKPEGMP